MGKNTIKKHQIKKRRAIRARSRIHGTASRPRLSVFRSAKHIFVQLIDDDAGKTLASSSDYLIKETGKKPIEIAALIGEDIAKKAKEVGISAIIFDRGSNKYHGRVKALAEAARNGSLEF